MTDANPQQERNEESSDSESIVVISESENNDELSDDDFLQDENIGELSDDENTFELLEDETIEEHSDDEMIDEISEEAESIDGQSESSDSYVVISEDEHIDEPINEPIDYYSDEEYIPEIKFPIPIAKRR